VRLLVDANLSPKVAAALSKAGLESVHVGDVGLLTASDQGILDYAAANENATKAVRGALRYRAISLGFGNSAGFGAWVTGSGCSSGCVERLDEFRRSLELRSSTGLFLWSFLITIMLFVLTLLPVCSLARLLRRLPKKP